MKHKAFENALANMFVNGRGELSGNLDRSRSKVAKGLRVERSKKDLRAELAALSRRLKREGCKPCIVAALADCQGRLAAL